MKYQAGEYNSAAIIAELVSKSWSFQFKLSERHQEILLDSTVLAILRAIHAGSRGWEGGLSGPSTKELIQAALKVNPRSRCRSCL